MLIHQFNGNPCRQHLFTDRLGLQQSKDMEVGRDAMLLAQYIHAHLGNTGAFCRLTVFLPDLDDRHRHLLQGGTTVNKARASHKVEPPHATRKPELCITARSCGDSRFAMMRVLSLAQVIPDQIALLGSYGAGRLAGHGTLFQCIRRRFTEQEAMICRHRNRCRTGIIHQP